MTSAIITAAVLLACLAIILAVTFGERWLRSFRYKRDQREQAASQPAKPEQASPQPADIRGDVVIIAERCGCIRYLKPAGQDPCGRHERIYRENVLVRELDRQFRGQG